MIKINGNRIEPAEIEAAIRSILDIDWCAARGFVDDDQSFICAYYKDDIIFDAGRYTFAQLKTAVGGKTSLIQKIRNIFSRKKHDV